MGIGQNPYYDAMGVPWGYYGFSHPYITDTPNPADFPATTTEPTQPIALETSSTATPTLTTSTPTTSTAVAGTATSGTTNPYDIQAAVNSLVNSLTQPASTANTGYTSSGFSGAYGFPATDREKNVAPIWYNGQWVFPSGTGAATSSDHKGDVLSGDSLWQAALDSVYGRKTGWNTGTNW